MSIFLQKVKDLRAARNYCSHDYDVMIGALPTEASTCTELTDLHFLRKKKQPESKKKI